MLAASVAIGCSPKLPEPDSPGAQLYAQRCDTCHRVFAPSTLKYEMWKYPGRSHARRDGASRPPAADRAEERTTLLDYLKRHSG